MVDASAKLAELRAALSDSQNTELSDADCLRFLTARSADVPKTVAMLGNWETWWNTPLPGHETMLPRDPDLLNPDTKENIYNDLLPHANLGEDKEGRPIYWERTGLISSRFQEVKKHLTEDEIFVRHIRQQQVMVHRLEECSKRYGRLIEKQVLVLDMKNVSLQMDFMALSAFKRTVKIDEACYPERLHVLYVINAPILFHVLWAIVAPWIDNVTKSKFRILGKNYPQILKENIPENMIPEEYGGTLKDMSWVYPSNIAMDLDELRTRLNASKAPTVEDTPDASPDEASVQLKEG